jgi:zinc/manganese transport system permease protein
MIPATAIMRKVTMLQYDFMVHAFAAAGIVSILAGVVGYFLVLRGQAFAGHALSHVGFAGAAGAVLLGIPPLWGLVGFTLAGGFGMGLLGEKLAGRDVAIGMVLTLSLGLGLLFLHFYTAYATQATAVLFGNILAVDWATIRVLCLLAAVSMGGLAVIARPLLFASLQPELAEAKGVPLRLLGFLFLGIVALTVSSAAQIVGVLMIFTLMIGPAAAALNLSSRIGAGLLLAAFLALAEAWGGIAAAYETDWPVSFWIAALSGLVYFSSFAAGPWRAYQVRAAASLYPLERGIS